MGDHRLSSGVLLYPATRRWPSTNLHLTSQKQVNLETVITIDLKSDAWVLAGFIWHQKGSDILCYKNFGLHWVTERYQLLKVNTTPGVSWRSCFWELTSCNIQVVDRHRYFVVKCCLYVTAIREATIWRHSKSTATSLTYVTHISINTSIVFSQ
jgi:hypothetical protein